MDLPMVNVLTLKWGALDQDALIAEDVLSANPGLRILLINVSPLTASVDPSVPLGQMDFAAKYYLLHWLHRNRQIRDLKGSLVTFRDCMVEAVASEKIRGFEESVKAYAANCGLQYIDLFQERFDAGQWHDCNHLALEGARELTAMVRQRIFGWKGIGE